MKVAVFTAALLVVPLVSCPLVPRGVASPLCGARADILAKLAKEFGEAPTALGLASNGGVVELLSSDSGSWTLMITFAPAPGSPAGGRTCLIATGEGWQSVRPQPRDPLTDIRPGRGA